MEISQAEFGRLMGVSRKTITDWKSKGRIVMIGDQVDRDASLKKLVDAGNVRARAVTSGQPEVVTPRRKSVTPYPPLLPPRAPRRRQVTPRVTPGNRLRGPGARVGRRRPRPPSGSF